MFMIPMPPTKSEMLAIEPKTRLKIRWVVELLDKVRAQTNFDLLVPAHFENLPAKLKAESVDPRIPWPYGFELDFRFR